jgi:FkbM family methyltransferase
MRKSTSTNVAINGEKFFLEKVLENRKGKPVIFDVGANVGIYSEMVIQELKRQNITEYELHVFEPQKVAFEILRKKFKENTSVIANNFGLSDTRGPAIMYSEYHGGEGSSLYKRKAIDLNQEEKIHLETVADYVLKNNISNITLLKIDTEGNEKKVLLGCGSFLRPENISAIQFEYGGCFSDAGITLKEVVRLLQEKNYSVGKLLASTVEYQEDLSLFLEDYRYSNYGAIEKNSIKKTSEITSIIFSKNRACQLELLLRGLTIPVSVLYAYDPEFKAGYDKLMGMYPEVNFVHETNFKDQLVALVAGGNEYTMFFVDDILALEPFIEDCPEFAELKRDPEILCLSLRLAPYHKDTPVFKRKNVWEWKNSGVRTQFGYPMSVDGHIYRKEDLLATITNNFFDTPNSLEGLLMKNIPPNRPLMICFDKPKIVNNIANQVNGGRGAKSFGKNKKELEERFLKGERISLEDMKEKASKADECFLRTDYVMEADPRFVSGEENNTQSCFAKTTQDKNNWLSDFAQDVTSRDGEDGILKKIFEILEIKNGWCVDVGARGVRGSNTFNVLVNGWSGVLFIKESRRYKRLRNMYRNWSVQCFNERVVPFGEKNLDRLLETTPVPREFDLLVLNMDGNDYYLWGSLQNYKPAVVVASFSSHRRFDDYLQSIDGVGGVSLSYLVTLGKQKGYELISTTVSNAFFVRKELFDKFSIEDNSMKELLVKSSHVPLANIKIPANAFEYIVEKFKVDMRQPSPAWLPLEREIGFPDLLKELGFKRGVEIGVYKGEYSEILMSRIPGLELTGVDVWQVYDTYADYAESNIRSAYDKAKERAEIYKFTLLREYSTEAVKKFEDESLDFIYIDGNHDFAHVIEDLNIWSPKVKKGGIISGHDFLECSQLRCGVKDAVPAWCHYLKVPMLFITGGDSIPSWFYVKK